MKRLIMMLAVAGMVSGSGLVFAADEGNKGFIYLNNKVCPISGEEVGKMGPAVEVEYNGTKVNLCCKMCKKDFEKDPEGYIKRLKEMQVNEGEESADSIQH